jgi:hypothetical protein
MTQPTLSEAADAPAALTAFLRGIERRGAVFADLMCGDPAAAEQAFAVALRHFRGHALSQPFAHWPRLFWRTLLASPVLRGGVAAPRWAPGFEVLGEAGAGPRAALLLRLVAGLADAEAAAVLGVAPATYRLALRRALPHREDGSPDPEAWRTLDRQVQEAIRGLPAERLAHLARLRQAAVQGRRPELIGPLPVPHEPDADPASDMPHRGLRRALWAGVAACVLALLASFLFPAGWRAEVGGDGDPQVRVRPLGAAASPAARYDAAFGLLGERDFELLAAPPAQPPLDDPAFYAWYAAELGRDPATADPEAGMRDPIEEAIPLEGMPPDAPTRETESIDAP